MDKKIIGLFLVLILAVAGLVLFESNPQNSGQPASAPVPAVSQPGNLNNKTPQPNPVPLAGQAAQNASGFLPPLDRAGERVTKKPFGIFITPRGLLGKVIAKKIRDRLWRSGGANL